MPPSQVEDWSLISPRNLPVTKDSKKLRFEDIQMALEDPNKHKRCSVVKGEMEWKWEDFERVKYVPESFHGNLLQPRGAREWLFEPGMVS